MRFAETLFMQPADLQPRRHETIPELSQRLSEGLKEYPFEGVLMWHGDETSPLFTLQWRLGEEDEQEADLFEVDEEEDVPEGWHVRELEWAGQRLGRLAVKGRPPEDYEGVEELLDRFSKSLGQLLSPILEEPDSLPELLEQVDQELEEVDEPSSALHWTSHNLYRPSKIPRSVTNRVLVDWL